jgi:hypothetical protein
LWLVVFVGVLAMRSKLLVGLAGLVLACAGSPVLAVTTVNLDTSGDITNSGFDTGSLSPWVAGGNGAVVYQPGASQYPSAPYAPSPNYVVAIPGTGGNGDGSVLQTLSLTFAANTTYNLTFYVGLPTNVFGTAGPPFTGNCSAGCANHADGGTTAYAYLGWDNSGSLVGGGFASVTGFTKTFVNGDLGTWVAETISVTTGAGGDPIGKNIDIMFRASATSTDQPHQVDFDIVTAGVTPFCTESCSSTPLPTAVWLFGSVIGLGGALRLRRRKAKLA